MLASGLADAARAARVPLQVNAFGSLITPFFTDRPVTNCASAMQADAKAFSVFFRGMLKRGIYLPPSQFEACFLSAAHTERDVATTLKAATAAMKEVAKASPGARP
jgi:glutamate-1-semialdehyde 2,1-aminomutase